MSARSRAKPWWEDCEALGHDGLAVCGWCEASSRRHQLLARRTVFDYLDDPPLPLCWIGPPQPFAAPMFAQFIDIIDPYTMEPI
jgi:hypothetical protein